VFPSVRPRPIPNIISLSGAASLDSTPQHIYLLSFVCPPKQPQKFNSFSSPRDPCEPSRGGVNIYGSAGDKDGIW